ncbi:MAG: sulfite exporter TauE/SafE family protein [Polaromonas sp.]|nr:sulfite exporter TauE/SafE family protein [Polaromonas sp.]
MAAYTVVLLAGLAAGCLSGVIGTGSSILLLPLLVHAFGPKQAVPIMAIAALMANFSRVLAWWREVDWKAVAAYVIPGVPAAALGARTLLALPANVIEISLGIFFLGMIPVRHLLMRLQWKARLWHLALAGAVIGFLTGIVLSTGPLSVPVFLAYGLVKGAFLATEAASSLFIYIAKVMTFREFGALPGEVILQGLIVGVSLMAGTFAGKALVLRMSPAAHGHVLDGLLLMSGLALLAAALTG